MATRAEHSDAKAVRKHKQSELLSTSNCSQGWWAIVFSLAALEVGALGYRFSGEPYVPYMNFFQYFLQYLQRHFRRYLQQHFLR